MITQNQAENAIDWIRNHAEQFGQARANRVYLEEYRKSKKAMLIQEADGTVQERDSYAYAHPDYLQVLKGIRAAVEAEEHLRWLYVAAQAKVEAWRTQESTRRAEMSRWVEN